MFLMYVNCSKQNLKQNLSILMLDPLPPKIMVQWKTRSWFQIFFIFTPIWGRFPIWIIFFRWVETTNYIENGCIWKETIVLDFITTKRPRLTPAAVQSAALSTAFALMAEPVGDVRVQWFSIWVFPKNRGGPPQIIHFNKVFHFKIYKPSILGFPPYFWKHLYVWSNYSGFSPSK